MTIKEYKKKLKSNKSFILISEKLEKIKSDLKENYSTLEVKLLLSVSKRNLDKMEPSKILNYLVNTTTNRERLVEISNMLLSYRTVVNIIIFKVKSILETEEFFFELKRQDRKLYMDNILLNFNILLLKIDSYLDIVDSGINHLDKVQFNIKSIISYKKNGNGNGTE